jgi:hypothetical protein
MELTPLGAKTATMGAPERKQVGTKILRGEDITKYTKGAICYDTVAFVRYLLGARIAPNDLLHINGQAWKTKFAFESGSVWEGKSALPAGAAVGFWRLGDKNLFHASIASGASKVRGTNGGKFGAGWQEVDLHKVLGAAAGADKMFPFENTKIKVLVSKM